MIAHLWFFVFFSNCIFFCVMYDDVLLVFILIFLKLILTFLVKFLYLFVINGKAQKKKLFKLIFKIITKFSIFTLQCPIQHHRKRLIINISKSFKINFVYCSCDIFTQFISTKIRFKIFKKFLFFFIFFSHQNSLYLLN